MTPIAASAAPADAAVDARVVMDLPTAAAYAGVAIAVLARAVHRRELAACVAAGGQLLLERGALETWAERG
jgi:high-affinity K+ transport system ATPase subunit B